MVYFNLILNMKAQSWGTFLSCSYCVLQHDVVMSNYLLSHNFIMQ